MQKYLTDSLATAQPAALPIEEASVVDKESFLLFDEAHTVC